MGDADPWAAIQDALVHFQADEVVIATFPPGQSHWLERRLITTAQAGLAPLPVTHLISGTGSTSRERLALRLPSPGPAPGS